jgi:chromosome segregation ATPase
MGHSPGDRSDFRVTVENVGGISRTEVSLDPGVTVLVGRNATNRTSFLQAVMAALGSEHVSLKGDSDSGFVELDIGSETYTRRMERTPDGIRTDGNPHLDDPEPADLFAFLLESNEARRAVVRGDGLRDLMMRPVDTDEISAEIDRLKQERRALDDDLAELDDLSDRLPDLEAERSRLTDRIEELRADLEDAREQLDATDVSVQSVQTEEEALEEALDALSEARSELESVRFDLETERESLDSLVETRDELERELAAADDPPDDLSWIETEIERLRDHQRDLDDVVTQLQNVIEFNERMLEGTSDEVVAALRDADDSDAVTDQLLASETVVCWTCGSEVARDRVEDTLDRLRDVRQEKVSERRDVRDTIDEYQREIDEHETKRREHERRTRRLQETVDEIERRERTIETLEERQESLTERIEELEREVDELETETYSEILEQHKRVNELEFELDRIESERHEVTAEIREVQSRLADREELAAERERVQEDLEEQRTRIRRIERTAVDRFNDHMEDLLSHLDYGNIERIWIERVADGDETRPDREITPATFELHVVRASNTGSVYRDTIDHLSESEREVTGLVFALAGYLTHEVYETVPFLLLDSLEALDARRVADLVSYFATYADNLLVALLPEDAAALDDDYHRVRDI